MWRPFPLTLATHPWSPLYKAGGSPIGRVGDPPKQEINKKFESIRGEVATAKTSDL